MIESLAETIESRPEATGSRSKIIKEEREAFMIKAVIFDMDGVIIDSEMEYLKYIYEFAKEKNPELKIEELYGTVGTTNKDCWIIVEKALHNGETWEELRVQYRPRWDEVFDLVDYKAIFRPEVLEVMDRLKEMGLRLAVASSTNIEQVEKILKMNHVAERLELMVSGGMFKRSKPDPEIYLYTAEQLGAKPEECLVIEDSTVGITAGHRAGTRVAALIDERFQFDRSLADYEIGGLREIIPLAERLMER